MTFSKFLSRFRLSLSYTTLSLITGTSFLIITTVIFGTLTQTQRVDIKREADVFIIRLLESHPGTPDEKMKFFDSVREGLGILKSDIWIIDKSKAVLASSTSKPVPEISIEQINAAQIHRFKYRVRGSNFDPFLVGLAQFENKDWCLVTSQGPSNAIADLRTFYFKILFTGLFIYVFLNVLILYLYLRRRAQLIRSTFKSIKDGDLKARINVRHIDEIDQLSIEFNAMADEMADLVGKVQANEAGRMALLRELSHDLRSPIAALRGLIENLGDYGTQMTTEQRLETIAVAKREIGHLQNLTENLLFLAQMKGAKYQRKEVAVDILNLVAAEVLLFQKTSARSAAPKLVEFSTSESKNSGSIVLGDPDLLQRAFRNILENSLRHAKTRVHIEAKKDESFYKFTVSDDGPGFPEELLKGFDSLAQKYLVDFVPNRLNSGLGLLITHQIILLHVGKFQIANNNGAICRIEIPSLKERP